MIVNFKIENYKAFENIELLNLSRINLIGGKNNVGKTSILEAIFCMYDRLSIDILFKSLLWRSSTPGINITDDVWLPVFYNFDPSKEITLKATDENKVVETATFRLDKNFIPPPNQDINKLTNLTGQIASNRPRSALRFEVKSNENQIQKTFIYVNGNSLSAHNDVLHIKKLPSVQYYSTRSSNPQRDSISYGNIMKQNLEYIVIDALKIIEPRLKSIVPIQGNNNQTSLYGDIGLASKIPISYMGDGVTRLLAYIIAIVSNPNGIVLFDEIENGLHYSIHSDMWALFYKLSLNFNVQIIANTHSVELVNAFNKVSLDHDKNEFPYYEIFQPTDKPISVNYMDSETLNYKIQAQKSFRGE